MCLDFYNQGASLHPIPIEFMERTFDRILEDHSGNLFCYKILDENNNIAGYALVFIYWSNEVGGETCFLDELYIKSEFRAKGLGKKFIEFLVKEFSQRVRRFRLDVCDNNEKAINLYSEYGFEFLGYKQMIKDI